MAFADDLKLSLAYRREEILNVSAILQHDLDGIVRNSGSWNLMLNADKCVVMRFKRGRHQELGVVSYHINGRPLC